MTQGTRFRSTSLIVYLMMGGGLTAAALAPLILFIEFFEWLTSSEWPGLTLADGLGLFGVHHEGTETAAQRLIDLMFAVPLSVALFFTGVAAFLLGASFGDWAEERRLEAELRDGPPLHWLTFFGAPDVSFPALVRLLLLDTLLRAVAIIGAAFLYAEIVLFLAGSPRGWLGAAGLGLLLAAWLTHRAERRKLTDRERPR